MPGVRCATDWVSSKDSGVTYTISRRGSHGTDIISLHECGKLTRKGAVRDQNSSYHRDSACAGRVRPGLRQEPERAGEMARGYTPTLEDAAKAYNETCAGGDRVSNNCAHFLSDAFIRAGFTELETSDLITERCPHGRPLRAQEMLKWFQSKAERFHSGRLEPNTGYWASYQENPRRSCDHTGHQHRVYARQRTGRCSGTTNGSR